MSSGNENKIERSFPKKIETKKEEVIMSNIAVMEEQKQITIKPKRIYKKKATAVEEPQPLSEAGEFFQQPGDLMVDGIDTSAEEQAYKEGVEEEEDEEAILLAKLAEVKQKKAIVQARENIVELRKTFCEETEQHRQAILVKYHQLNEEQLACQSKIFKINEGEFDEELITKSTQPKPKTERTTDRVVTAVGEGKFRQQATINLNTKYDSFKKQLLGEGQFTKVEKGYSWSLYGKAKHLVARSVVEGKATYSLPTFKEVKAMELGFDKNEDLRDWIEEQLDVEN